MSTSKIKRRGDLVVPKVVTYTDGKDTWQVEPGKPNGTFHIPGFPDDVFSVSSFVEMVRRNCRRVKIVGGKIEEGGDLSIEDGLALCGDAVERKSVETDKPTVKGKKSAAENREMIKDHLATCPDGATKKEISFVTGLSIPVVNALLLNMKDVVGDKNTGPAKKYKLLRG